MPSDCHSVYVYAHTVHTLYTHTVDSTSMNEECEAVKTTL